MRNKFLFRNHKLNNIGLHLRDINIKLGKKQISKDVIKTPFVFREFSPKQMAIMNWWKLEDYKNKDGIISDGAVRSGKTMSFSLSFVEWAMTTFNKRNFGIAGQSISATMENVVNDLIIMLNALKVRSDPKGMKIKYAYLKKKKLIVSAKITDPKTGRRVTHTNHFEVIGGRDSSSFKLIQGRTYAGAMIDEVVLQPEGFINQLITRCSIEGRKIWYTCNPEGPLHWFKIKFIDKITELNLIRIHFRLEDNPSLAQSIIDGYKRQFKGVFFQRYIEGLWSTAEGLVYSMFDTVKNVIDKFKIPRLADSHYLSIDYGTRNPFRCGLYHIDKGVYRDSIYKVDEYSHSGRDTHIDKTDSMYVDDIIKFCDMYGLEPEDLNGVIVDPSATSLISELRVRGFKVFSACNEVIAGIRKTAEALHKGLLKITEDCIYTLQEFHQYMWDNKASEKGEDKVVKTHDHSMDELRYLIYSLWRWGIIKI